MVTHSNAILRGMRLSGGAACLLAAALVLCGCGARGGSSQTAVRIPQPLPATPVGITLVDVVQVVGVSPPDYLWTHLGDANGKTLYISAADTSAGVSRCVGACAEEFPPVLAASGAVGFGDWSLVKRPDGGMQWAYQGKPLYTYAKETKVEQVVNTLLAQDAHVEQEYFKGFGDHLPPPPGWSVARFLPEKGLVRPAPIGVKTLAVQDGMGDALATAGGMTLYGYDGSARAAGKAVCAQTAQGDRGCSATFEPYLAPETASAVGDFSIVRRDSGDAGQWAYKGVPLYTFSGDHKPTDAYGVYRDYGPWRVMLLYLDAFPANVQAVESLGHDKILADARGKPLYERAHFRELFGGATAYHDYGAPYYMGKAIGAGGCDAACLKIRRPLPAPADAQAKGDWMVYTREDGSKQWAFKGFALYTYTGDTRPGIVNGHNVTDYVVGDAGPYKISDATAEEPMAGGMGLDNLGVGLFWFVSHPDWLGR